MKTLEASLCSLQSRFVPATDHNGSRIRVRWSYGRTGASKTVPYRHELSAEGNHTSAALELIRQTCSPDELSRLESYTLVSAQNPDGTVSHVFYPCP
jgi:hypothetical protein